MAVKNHLKNPVIWTIVVLFLVTLIVQHSKYLETVMFTIFIYMAISLGWNYTGGFMDYVDFGYASWIGIGGFGTAAMLHAGFAWAVSLIVGGLIAALIAYGIGLSVLRLRGRYFTIATLGFFGMVKVAVASKYLKPWTGGGAGIYLKTGLGVSECLWILAFICFASIAVTYALAKSQIGKEMLAIKSDEAAAEMIGVNTSRIKRLGYALSAFIGGLTGGVIGLYLFFLAPSSVLNSKYLLFPVIIAIFGGRGSVIGPVIGAIIFGVVYEIFWSVAPQFFLIMIGLFLILMMLFLPEGIIPWLKTKNKLPKVREW